MKTRYFARFPNGVEIERTTSAELSLAWLIVVLHPEGGRWWEAGFSASKDAANRSRAHARSYMTSRPVKGGGSAHHPETRVIFDGLIDADRLEARPDGSNKVRVINLDVLEALQ